MSFNHVAMLQIHHCDLPIKQWKADCLAKQMKHQYLTIRRVGLHEGKTSEWYASGGHWDGFSGWSKGFQYSSTRRSECQKHTLTALNYVISSTPQHFGSEPDVQLTRPGLSLHNFSIWRIIYSILTFRSLLVTRCTYRYKIHELIYCSHCIYVFCIYLRIATSAP